jgi:hypothetical protein
MSLNTVAEVLLLQGDIEKGYQLKTIFSHRMIYLNLTMPNKVPSGISYWIQRRAESYNLPMRFCKVIIIQKKLRYQILNVHQQILNKVTDVFLYAYRGVHASRHVRNKNVISSVQNSDDIKFWLQIWNGGRQIIISRKIDVPCDHRPDALCVANGVVFVWGFSVVFVRTRWVIVAEMHCLWQ